MGTGAITQSIDVTSILFTLFILFFVGLVRYLILESKRDGFPLESQRFGKIYNESGFLGLPISKIYKQAFGKTFVAPLKEAPAPEVLNAKPAHRMNGAPLVPLGNPLLAGVGPGSFANRQDVPDAGLHGEPRILPKRLLEGWAVLAGDPNPVNLNVYGADLKVAGTVNEIWIDHMESMIRYLEVKLASGKLVMLPFNFATFTKFGVDVDAILSHQFEDVPALKNPDQITLLEEDKIMAYFGAGTLYATPSRQEPLI